MLLLTFLLAILLSAGCASAPHSSTTPPLGSGTSSPVADINSALAVAATQPTAARDYRIGPEDLLDITVYNVTGAGANLTPRNLTVRVSQQGVITLPTVGEVHASGLTISALEQTLQQHYDKYIHSPQIGVMVKEYRSLTVSVLGAVSKPGMMSLMGPKSLMEVLVMAGGLSPTAGPRIRLYRQDGGTRETHVIDLTNLTITETFLDSTSVSLDVRHGDVIYVPDAGTFYVDGAVNGPGSYPLGARYTLTKALSRAGGINRDLADTSEIVIIRRHSETAAQKISVDVDQILHGEAPDPTVEADDIIIVQTSTLKWLYRQFFMGAFRVPNLVPQPTFRVP